MNTELAGCASLDPAYAYHAQHIELFKVDIVMFHRISCDTGRCLNNRRRGCPTDGMVYIPASTVSIGTTDARRRVQHQSSGAGAAELA